MAIHVDRDLELGPDTIGGGHQQGFLILALRQLEEPAEAAKSPHHAGAQGRFGKRFDAFYKGAAVVDIDAGVAVTERGECFIDHAGMVARGIWGVNRYECLARLDIKEAFA